MHACLGICTLKAILNREELAADTGHPSIRMARRVGVHWYNFLSAFCGRFSPEVLFTPHVFRKDPEEFAATVLPRFYVGLFESLEDTRGLRPPKRFREDFPGAMRDLCVEQIPAFLDEFMTSIQWTRYDVIGFSLITGQVLASIAAAAKIKERWPEKCIVLGGPSCAGGMGEELLRRFECVDIVAVGEADLTVAPLVRAVRRGSCLDAIPGLVFRRQGRCVSTGEPRIVQDLDVLPIPDFVDCVRELAPVARAEIPLSFETSRGCWWGQRSPCLFCGLNCRRQDYRKKSAHRALREITTLADRYEVKNLRATDTILDLHYFEELMPALASANENRPTDARLRFFYETKSNLTKHQMRRLRTAGVVDLQPGIESLSDDILRLMNKGSSSFHQIQLIKWADELGIRAHYGILYGVPGERPEHYDAMRILVESVSHLTPPTYISPVGLDRFSPYFSDPARYGIHSIEPFDTDRMMFPDTEVDLAKVLFRFQFAYSDCDAVALVESRDRCLRRLRKWRDEYRPGALTYTIRDGDVRIVDRRGTEPRLLVLSGVLGELYVFLDCGHAFEGILAWFAKLGKETLRDCLEWLCSERLICWDSRRDRYLAVAVSGGDAAPEPEEVLLRTAEDCRQPPVHDLTYIRQRVISRRPRTSACQRLSGPRAVGRRSP
jgi:ribosomal peptide maturation radical SAM protein 1